jgi:hypothetical protein
MSVGRFLQQAAAGNAGEAVYVDDVFSTYLYDGVAGPLTITNNINLVDEGGLVWIKKRDGTSNHALFDTERGARKYLSSNTTASEITDNVSLDFFRTYGFILGSSSVVSNSGNFTSWTFRKQPGFFDVVTYTGDGTSNRNISHSLDSAPGAILIKRTDSASSTAWMVWHRSGSPQSGTYGLMLNYTNGWGNIGADIWGTSGPNMTSTTFSVGNYSDVNASGGTYVAYLFAHDAQEFGTDSDESIIKCGSYTGNGSTTGPVIDLGFEPQWVMIKNISFANDWWVFDSMRGITSGGADSSLRANLSSAENTGTNALKVTATGFQLENSGGDYNGNTQNYIYVAIRRPHKPAEEFAATDLFALQETTTSGAPLYNSSFPVDMGWYRFNTSSDAMNVGTRLLQGTKLETSSTSAESTSSQFAFDYSNGWNSNANAYTNIIGYMFRRAPGFFDVVAYTGNSTVRTINHNLGVTPKLAISKSRDDATNWWVYAEFLGDTNYLRLNLTSAVGSAGSNYLWGSTWTDTLFSVGAYSGINFSGYDYICYLFGDVSGISKVGSYTGTGSDVDVNCGFTSGARFVLVKRTDSTGDWYVWDSVRGIVAGNDPYLLLNSTAAQVTSTDYIDPLSSGFTITSSAPAALNTSGGTYIFLAIA